MPLFFQLRKKCTCWDTADKLQAQTVAMVTLRHLSVESILQVILLFVFKKYSFVYKVKILSY